MKRFTTWLAIGFVGLLVSMQVAAAPVSCGNASLGNRLFTVDPALVGGFCYAQNGNFIGDDLTVSGLDGIVLIEKDTTFPNAAGALQVSALANDNTMGTWSFDVSLWDTYDRLFLGAHYGQAGDRPDTNPDSFLIELSPFDATGTFALTGDNIQLNGLSNLYLAGIRCAEPGCNEELLVPEPGTLLLFSLGLLGLAVGRRLS